MAGEIDAFLAFGPWKRGGMRFDIDGETGDAIERKVGGGDWPLRKSMQIQSYDLGFDLNANWTEETRTTGSTEQSMDPDVRPATITKSIDTASPFLLMALWKGNMYKHVVISQRKAGGGKGMSGDYFWEIALFDVVVQNLSWRGDAGAPTETVSLKYKGIQVWYTPQKSTGALDASQMKCTPYQPDHLQLGRPQAVKSTPNLSDPKQMQSIVDQVIQELKSKGIKV